jgi:hypothetical protein
VQLHEKLRENQAVVGTQAGTSAVEGMRPLSAGRPGTPCAAGNENSKETAVPPVQNGVQASSLGACWIKSRHSNAEGNCVEVAPLVDGGIAMRNSRDPDGPALVYTSAEVAAFLAGAKDGEFDHLL